MRQWQCGLNALAGRTTFKPTRLNRRRSVRFQRICSPRSGVKDCLLTNPAKFRETKEKFGHRRCREDMWAKYINRSEQLCKGPSGTRGASTSERGRYAEFE